MCQDTQAVEPCCREAQAVGSWNDQTSRENLLLWELTPEPWRRSPSSEGKTSLVALDLGDHQAHRMEAVVAADTICSCSGFPP